VRLAVIPRAEVFDRPEESALFSEDLKEADSSLRSE
jgi:hypothetical protein